MVINIGGKKKIRKSKKHHFKVEADLRVSVKREDGCIIVYCPELELSSYGETIEDAMKNFTEVLEIFFEDIIKRGTIEDVLRECGWHKVSSKPIPHWVPPAFIAEKKIPLAVTW